MEKLRVADSWNAFLAAWGHWLPTLFLGGYLLVGLVLVSDYGVSSDETVQVVHAEVQLDYAARQLGLEGWEPYHPDKELETYSARHYSMLYGMFSTLIAEGLGYERGNLRLAFQVRHYVVFLLFWLACLVFYRTLKVRFTGWRLPLLGVFLLVLTPRIFANAFYNPKDMILLAFYVYATASLVWLLRRRDWVSLLVHALMTGLVLNTRLPAMFLPLMTLVILWLEVIQARKGGWKTLGQSVVYLAVSFVVFVALFPYLWEDTFARIAEVYQRMAKFNWGSHNLIFNEFIPGDETPAWYIPAWIVITTPLATLLLLLGGLTLLLRKQLLLLRKSISQVGRVRKSAFWTTENEKLDLLQLGLGLGPLLAVIVLGSNLYNGWRHLYFIYPSLLWLGVVCWQWLQETLRPRWATAARYLLAGNLVWIVAFMVIYHPHQQVYFNALAGHHLTKRYDMDYWGLSYYQALKRLARDTPDGAKTNVTAASVDAWYNVIYLPPDLRKKINFDWSDSHRGYYLSNFRRPGPHRAFFEGTPPHDQPYFFIEVMGDPILGVFHKSPGGSPKWD